MGRFDYELPNPFADSLCFPYYYWVIGFTISSIIIMCIFYIVEHYSIPMYRRWVDIESFLEDKIQWNREAHNQIIGLLEEKIPQSGMGDLILSYLPHFSEVYEVDWWRYRKGGEVEDWKIKADKIEVALAIYPLIRPFWMLLCWIAMFAVYGEWASHIDSSWTGYAGLTVAMLYHPCIKLVGLTLRSYLYDHYHNAYIDGKYRVSSFYKRAILAMTTNLNGRMNMVSIVLIIGMGIAPYLVGFVVFMPIILCIAATALCIAGSITFCWNFFSLPNFFTTQLITTVLPILFVCSLWLSVVTALPFVQGKGYVAALEYGLYGQYCSGDKEARAIVWNTSNMDWRHWILIIGWILF